MRKNFRRAADSPAADQSRPHWIKGQEPEAPCFRAGDGSASSVVRACHGLPIMSWSRAFHIPIPDGRVLRTLRDAGDYIQALPGAKHKRPEWQIAAEMVLAAVEGSGSLM